MNFSSLVSGTCAALASVFGKIAFGNTIKNFVEEWNFENYLRRVVVEYTLRACSLSLVLLLNTFMLHFYIQALQKHGSIAATVSNTSVNMIVSSLLGYLLFAEILAKEWLVGAFLTLLGVFCIQKAVGEIVHREENKIQREKKE
mmetsp:Transcript_2894/g.3662  ORF Transcript_2894/g.3662 Transcript_2894/m.3662 type:complete len:144 (-) Transcript_2894:840-1271(-)